MIDINSGFKVGFNSNNKDIILTFDDGTIIRNNDIGLESLEFVQSISEENTLKYGKVNASSFKIKVKNNKSYKGLWFNVGLKVAAWTLPLGRFCVYSDVSNDQSGYSDIVAYDKLFYVFDKDLKDWYLSLSFPITVKDFRDSLFEHVGIEQLEVTLPNDDVLINQTIDGNGLTFRKAIESICEINACFGCINNEGKFKYVSLEIYEYAEVSAFNGSNILQNTLKTENILSGKINKVTIKETEDDLGFSYGDETREGSEYSIVDNFLMYGADDETLRTVAYRFYNKVYRTYYKPFSFKTLGKPWLEIGDVINFHNASESIGGIGYILNRSYKGIQAPQDDFSAKGTETFEENKASNIYTDIQQLKGRTNSLIRTLDETKSEIERIESENEQFKTTVEQSFDEITLKVESKVGDEELLSKINLSKGLIEIVGDLGITIDTPNFKLDKNGNAKFTYTGGAWINPTEKDLETIKNVMAGTVTVSDTVYKNMDFNCDGQITIKDALAMQRLIMGTMHVDEYVKKYGYEKQLSQIEMKIDPSDPINTITISGTNSFGSSFESNFGINTTKCVTLLAEGANVGELDVSGELVAGSVKTTGGADLDAIGAYKSQYVGFSYGGQGLGLTFYKVGRTCTVYVNNNVATGVANSTVTIGSGVIPADFRPVCNVKQLLEYNANGTRYSCQLGFTTNGNVTALASAGGALSLTGYTITYITAT